MAEIKKDIPSMDFPLQIKRQFGGPLDPSEIFYSLADAEEYAKNSPIAYVGQLIAVVDEEKKTVDVYVVLISGNLAKLAKVMEDIQQEQLGMVRSDYAEKKVRAAEIINELRVLEGKEPREVAE